MQVFLPERDVQVAVQRLDKSRAGNQCWRESETLWNYHWRRHPAHRIYGAKLSTDPYRAPLLQLHEEATDGNRAWFAYYNMCLIEHVFANDWCSRETYDKWLGIWHERLTSTNAVPTEPEWLARDDELTEAVISSHRACLLAKDFDWYSQFGWSEAPTPQDPLTGKWPYVWPE